MKIRKEGCRYIWYSGFCCFVNEFGFIICSTANDETRVVLSPCGILSRYFSLTPACVSNVHHLKQLPDCLVVVIFYIPLVVSRMLLSTIPSRYYICVAIWYGMTPLSMVVVWVWKYWWGIHLKCWVYEFYRFGWIKIHHYFIILWQWIIGIHFVVLLVI